MSNNTTKLKEELSAKGLCDENLLAWGQSDHVVAGAILGGAVGAAIGSAMSRIFAITKVGDAIAIFPYTNSHIIYEDIVKIEKQHISSMKISGLFTRKLKITTTDNKHFAYIITEGAPELVKILTKLGF